MNPLRKHNTRGIKVNIPTSLKRMPRSPGSSKDDKCRESCNQIVDVEVFEKVTAILSSVLKEVLEDSGDIVRVIGDVCEVIRDEESLCLQGQWEGVEIARGKLQNHLSMYLREKDQCNSDKVDTSTSKMELLKANSSHTHRRKRGRPRKIPLTTSDVASSDPSEKSPEQSDCRSEKLVESQDSPKQSRIASHTENAVVADNDRVESREDIAPHAILLQSSSLEKIYKCDLCEEAFVTTADLKRHSKEHKMEKVTSCVILEGESGDFLLKDSIALIDNFTVHGRKAYVCKKCGLKLRTKCTALQHLKDFHADVLEFNSRGQQESDVEMAENTKNLQDVFESENQSSQVDNAEGDVSTSTKMVEVASGNDAQTKLEVEKDHQMAEVSEMGGGSLVNEEKSNIEETESHGVMREEEGLEESGHWSLEDIGRKIRNPTRSLMATKPEKATEECGHCGFKSTHAGIASHVRRYHNSVLYTCDVCEKSFGAAGELNAHRKHHFDKEGKKKPLNWRVGYQYRKPDEPAKFLCQLCDKGFYRNVDLKHHMSVHEAGENAEGTTYQCGMCKFQSGNLPKVKHHIERHHSKNGSAYQPSKCDECPRVFTSEVRLYQHKEKFHGVDFICDQCDKKFSCRRYLAVHKKRHSVIKKYICDVCGRGFHENNKLLLHKEVHLSENERSRRYFCEVCQKTFSSNSYLKDHMNIHKGVCPYECGTCGRYFPTQAACRRHAMDHNKEPKFKCPVSECGKTFTAQFRLKYHMTVHTKQSKYTCTLCRKAYTQLSTLKRHVCKAQGNRGLATTLKSISNAPSGLLASPMVRDQVELVSEGVPLEKTVYCCSVCQMVFDNWNEIQLHIGKHAEATDTLKDTFTVGNVSGVITEPDAAVHALPDVQCLTATVGNIQDNIIEVVPENVIMETIVLTDNGNHGNQSEAVISTVLNDSITTGPIVLSDNETQVATVYCETETQVTGILNDGTEQYYDFDAAENSAETGTVKEETIVTMETKIVDQEH